MRTTELEGKLSYLRTSCCVKAFRLDKIEQLVGITVFLASKMKVGGELVAIKSNSLPTAALPIK